MSRNFYRPEGLVGLWYPGRGGPGQRRGTVNDESGSGNHGTIYGSPCLYFDGGNDRAYVTTPWNALGGFRYAVFAARAYLNASFARQQLLDQSWNGTTTSNILVNLEANETLRCGGRAGASGDAATVFISNSILSTPAWHSLMVLVDVEGDTMTMWDNGTLLPSTGNAQAFSQNTFANDTPAGQWFGETLGGFNDFTGKMQWLGYGGRNTPVTIADAQRYYDNPDAWLKQSGLGGIWYCKEGANGTVDNAEGTASRDLTLTGTTWNSLITSANGGNARNASGTVNTGDSFTSGYRFFDGANDRIGIPDSASLRLGTAPYQIHVWAVIAAAAGESRGILSKGDVGDATCWGLGTALDGADVNKLEWVASNTFILRSTGSIKDGKLHLLSAIRGESNITRLYVDGVQHATTTTAHTLSEATLNVNLMATYGPFLNAPCKGNLYAAMIGKANISIAEAENQMKSIFNQGPYR